MATDTRYVTDNNKWISKATGLPFALDHATEVFWAKAGPDNPDAIPNPNFGVVSTVETEVPDPEPNNPGNPYFGKIPMPTQKFWPFIQAALGADRMKRMVNDKNFIGIDKAMNKINIIDPDDKGGQFLEIVAFLVGTNGEDGKPLVEQAEIDAIMTAWK